MSEIIWDWNGNQIEQESFRRIEAETPAELRARFSDEEWHVARRLVHTTADFGILEFLDFGNNPMPAIREALRSGALIYCDSNMIKSGLSVPKLQRFNPVYSRESIICEVANPVVAEAAAREKITRALAAVRLFRRQLDGGIFLCGNAPLALAGMLELVKAGEIRPAAVVAMPVGFVNVVESKNLLNGMDIPFIRIQGRRGGSPLAVATLHAVMEPMV